MNNKGFIQISFPWLFAIVVGMIILFLAIYGVTKLIRTEQTIQDVKTSKRIGILLNPLEISFEEAKSTSLIFPVNTRMTNGCNTDGPFGRQLIKVSQKSFNKWTDTDLNIGFSNKYIFSKEVVEGKTFLVFSKPFNYPFKVTDLIYITSSLDKYCFIDAPDDINEEVDFINQDNLLMENCSDKEEVIRVCFEGGTGCDIKVNYNTGSVEKSDGKVYFEGDTLMYAAIFSNKSVYECHLKRIMLRVKSLAILYNQKANLIAGINCNTNLEPELIQLINDAEHFTSSLDLFKMSGLIETIDRKNKDNSICKLW